MPKLLAFLPCEKVIIAERASLEGGGTSSLIAVVESLSVGGSVPQDAKLPIRWYIYCLWHREPTEEETEYEQHVQMFYPSGKVAFTNVMPFKLSKRNHRNVYVVGGLPVGEVGEYVLRISLQRKGEPDTLQEYGMYPLRIEHHEETEPSKTESTEDKVAE